MAQYLTGVIFLELAAPLLEDSSFETEGKNQYYDRIIIHFIVTSQTDVDAQRR